MPSTILREIRGKAMFSLLKIIPVLLLSILAAGSVCGEETLEFKHKFQPGLLSANSEWTPSLHYDVSLLKTMWSEPDKQAFRKSLSARITTNGTLAGDADLNNESLLANGGLTTFINLYRPAIVSLGDQPGEYKTEQEGFNWGRLSFSLLAGYESDQTLDNRNFTGGGEIGYALVENKGIKALIPSIFVGYDFVSSDHSDLEEGSGSSGDSRRARVFASWKIPVGQLLPEAFDALNAHFDLRYYKSDGLPKAYRDADQDEAFYKAAALSYSFGTEPLWGVVNAVYVRFASGRIPPVIDDNTTMTVGLTVWER